MIKFFFLIQVTFPPKKLLRNDAALFMHANTKNKLQNNVCLWLFIYFIKTQTHIYICAYKYECNKKNMNLCVYTYNILMWDIAF